MLMGPDYQLGIYPTLAVVIITVASAISSNSRGSLAIRFTHISFVEGAYQNQEIHTERIRQSSEFLGIFRDEATTIYYRINELRCTQLKTDYCYESIIRAKATHMEHVSLRIQ
jgi:hypothetical protein